MPFVGTRGLGLRKLYDETFRFSEDLDFTVINGGAEEPDVATLLSDLVQARSGHEGTSIRIHSWL